MWLKPLQFGSLRIDFPVSLAPMAGVTNWPFRLLCKEQGCGFVVTEFVSDRALLFGSRRTFEMIELNADERPAGVQIFGAEPDTMAAAAARVVDRERPDFIDINMGCPAPKVTKGRGGSSLLREPETAAAIVRAVAAAVAPVPVTVKIRIGWDAQSINAVEIARRLEDAGARMITVHGRTRAQGYTGKADWDVIAAVARAVSVPVIGNGDVSTPAEALMRLQRSGCAGVAIGRGALGNPWIFGRLRRLIETGAPGPEPDAAERVRTALRHLDLMVESKGAYIGVREMRKHAAWYLKGLRGAAETRVLINQAETPEGMRDVLLGFLDRHLAGGFNPGDPADEAEAGVPDSCDAYLVEA